MGGYYLQHPLSKKARRVSAGKLCRLFGFYSSLTKGISLCFFHYVSTTILQKELLVDLEFVVDITKCAVKQFNGFG